MSFRYDLGGMGGVSPGFEEQHNDCIDKFEAQNGKPLLPERTIHDVLGKRIL